MQNAWNPDWNHENPLERYWFGASPQQAKLTKRETEICLLIARGLTNSEVAKALVPSVKTRAVESHIRNALSRLGLRNRTQICVWCWKHGLITPDEVN